MKVIQLIDGFYPLIGGGPLAIRTWIENMPDVKFEVITNAISGYNLSERYPYSNNCYIRRFSPKDITHSSIYKRRTKIVYFPYKILSDWVRFSRKIKYLKKTESDYDIIHFNGPVTNYGFFMFDRFLHRACLTKLNDFSSLRHPKVITLHGFPSEFTYNRADKENEERILKMFDNIICLSQHCLHKVEAYHSSDIEEKNIWHIPNGVDTRQFCPISWDEKEKKKNMLGFENKFLILFVGRMDFVKGLFYLFEAMKKVVSIHPNSYLLMVGVGGPDEKNLKEYANQLGISANIIFVGRVPNVYEYLKIADLFILPSLTEGMALVLLEAMATGLPVIATTVSGTPDVIETKKNGILIPPKDSESITSAILKLIDDNDLRIMIGKNARISIEKKFDIRVVVSQIKRVYEEISR